MADGGYKLCYTEFNFSNCDAVIAKDAACTATEPVTCSRVDVRDVEFSSVVFYSYEGLEQCAGMEIMDADGVAIGLMDADAIAN